MARKYLRRGTRYARKKATSYGKAFWTNKGKYGRYVYRFGKRVAFEELGRYATRRARGMRSRKK